MTRSQVTIKNADRDLWIDFVAKVKKNGEDVWGALVPHIKQYIKR